MNKIIFQCQDATYLISTKALFILKADSVVIKDHGNLEEIQNSNIEGIYLLNSKSASDADNELLDMLRKIDHNSSKTRSSSSSYVSSASDSNPIPRKEPPKKEKKIELQSGMI